MQDSQQSHDQRHLLLNMILIVLETVFSFILKNDSILRLQAKNFIQRQTTLKISSYLPYFEFYVQFSSKGLLFERTAPSTTIDLDVGLSLSDIIKIFLLGQQPQMDMLRIDGQAELSDEFRDLIVHFSAPRLFADWRQWLLPSAHLDPEDPFSSQRRVAPFLQKIEQQRQEIAALKMQLVQQNYRIDQAQVKQRNMLILLGSFSFILLLSLLYTVFIR